jgi:hypothetical protein
VAPRRDSELQERRTGGVPDAVDEDSPLVQAVRHREAKVLVDRVLEKAHSHHFHGDAWRARCLAVPGSSPVINILVETIWSAVRVLHVTILYTSTLSNRIRVN